MMTKTTLYRLYGEDDVVLYVGIAGDVHSRFAHHRSTRHWWPRVQRFDVQEFATRDEARAAEQAAIDELSPEYNKIRAQSKTPVRAFRCDDAVWDQVCDYADSHESTNTAVVVKALRQFFGEQD